MAKASNQTKLAILGAGKMGGILAEAFVKQGLVSPKNIFATVQHSGQARKSLSSLSIPAGTDNRAAVKKADVILLCVKPQTVGQVVDEIRKDLNDSKLVISIAASVPTDYIERRLKGKVPVIRAMPNTPSMVGAGITALGQGKIRERKAYRNGAVAFRLRRTHHRGRRKEYGRHHGPFSQRAGVHLHYSRIA